MKTLYSFIFLCFISFGFAQNADQKIKGSRDDIYTPLKPADGQPAVFGSQEELDASVPMKKQHARMAIQKLSNDTSVVKSLRWELWRLENAIVVKRQAEAKNETK